MEVLIDERVYLFISNLVIGNTRLGKMDRLLSQLLRLIQPPPLPTTTKGIFITMWVIMPSLLSMNGVVKVRVYYH